MTRPHRRAKTARSHDRSPIWPFVGQIAVIIVATWMVYLPALRGSFVWDDELLISKNPLLHSWSGLGEIWNFGRTADYFPLTNTIFWIEWHLFAENTAGYHVVNVVLQIANSLLVWALLRRLRIPGAWLAALIFAIHPVHVESVAWISELKNVLSMFFALISVLLFLRFQERKMDSACYLLSITTFVLALLAKTQVVFLPIVLLLVVWWHNRSASEGHKERSKPSRRTAPKSANSRSLLFDWSSLSGAFAATIPFFVVAIVLGLITVAFQNRGLGEEQVVLGGIGRRLVNAGLAVWWYVGKLFVPVRLMPIYPAWRFDSPRAIEWLPLFALLIILTVVGVWGARLGRAALVAVAGFVAALLPVLGFLQMSYARSGTLVADHYQYFADIFLIALVSAGIAWLWVRGDKRWRIAVAIVVGAGLITSGSYSRVRAGMYRDEETLWQDNLASNPDAWQAHNRLGQFYFDRERFVEAAPHFERAAALKPELAGNYNLLGLVYCRLGRFEEGIAEYRHALRIEETEPAADRSTATATMRTNLANALTITGNNMVEAQGETAQQAANRRYQEAIEQYQEALRLDPHQPAIHRNLGMLLARMGRYPEAIQHLRAVLEIVPNEPTARELLRALEQRESSQ